jgi:hypothetical protein
MVGVVPPPKMLIKMEKNDDNKYAVHREGPSLSDPVT